MFQSWDLMYRAWLQWAGCRCSRSPGCGQAQTRPGTFVAGRLYIQRPRHAFTRPPRWVLYIVLAGILIGGVIYETRTSALQSWLLSRYARSMTYTVEAGPSSTIVFPKSGPFDERHGYTQIPEFARRLQAKGFRIREQARFSPELARIAGWGIAPPYREPAVAGLTIHSADHLSVYDRTVSDRVFKRFEDVPPIVIEALLLIENRELGQEPPDSRTNPVLEWDRLAKAGITYAGTKLGLPLRVEGGSTLATQLEKYRHSQNGRTGSLADKLQQMAGASLKVYRGGTDTRTPRREIILDYLNTVPLAAAPGHGEIHGLGDGLNAWFGLNLSDVSEALADPEDYVCQGRGLQACIDTALFSPSAELLPCSQPRSASSQGEFLRQSAGENGRDRSGLRRAGESDAGGVCTASRDLRARVYSAAKNLDRRPDQSNGYAGDSRLLRPGSAAPRSSEYSRRCFAVPGDRKFSRT